MATQVLKGKAQVSGVVGTFDVIVYPVAQSGKATHQFKEETIMDQSGQDCAWRSYNEVVEGDFAMKVLGDTAAHAKTGGAFLAPFAVVTLSGFDVATWNTTYLVQPGSDLSQTNDKTSDITFKLKKYVDSTQNTLYATTPT